MKKLTAKIIFGILLCACVISYSACGNSNDGSTAGNQTDDPNNNYNHTIPAGASTSGSGTGTTSGNDSTGVNPAYHNRSGSTTVNNTTSSTTGNGTTGTTSGTTTGTTR